jgi:UDP:flavonoid glycosyltransferase YjiC (YdhE family)
VRCLWGPDISYRATHLEGGALAPMLARYRLDTVETLGTVTVDPCPPSMQLPSQLNRRTMRYVPYNGPSLAPPWVFDEAPRPRVCLTWGTATVKLGGPENFLLPYAVRAAVDLGVDVVVTITAEQRGLLGPVPDGVRVVESVPLHTVLPSCDAIVHQGGAGTTLTAAALGVPQLVIPQMPDQLVHAFQLDATGAGRFLLRRELAGDQLTAPIRDMLHEVLTGGGFAEAANRLRAEIEAQPAPVDLVGFLTDLAGVAA